MKLDVRLFARARDLAGGDTLAVHLPECARVADLRTALAETCPPLRPLIPRLLVAVGTNYADDSTPLTPTSDVACFPPVSGG